MPVLDGLESLDDEAYDDEAFDDESLDDESEFLGPIGGLLGGPAAAIGNVVGGLLGRPTPRPPLPRVSVPVAGPGVATATLNTPQGNATLRLPEPVVTRSEFQAGIQRLQEGINRDAARVNALSKDLDILRTRVGAVVTDTQRDVAKVRAEVVKSRRAQRAALARLRQEQSQQAMLSMMTGMMGQRSQADRLKEHTHPVVGAVAKASSDSDSGGSDMMMMLPMMMMGSGGGSGGDSMAMMMPLMIMAMDRD